MIAIMEALTLNEQEQRLYAELFGACDVENTGRVTGPRASELFLTSGLTPEVLHQITELCGAKRLGHFGRSQFYIALKLIAVAQRGLPPTVDSLNAGIEIPLPKFVRQFDADGRRAQIGQMGYSQPMTEQDIYNERMTTSMTQQGAPQQMGGLPPPPQGKRPSQTQRVIPGYDSHQFQGNAQDSPNDTRSPPFSPTGSPPMSPGAHPPLHKQMSAPGSYQTPIKQQQAPQGTVVGNHYGTGPGVHNSQMDGHHHHKTEKGWASFEDDSQGLISQETKQTNWAHFSDHKAETSSITSSEAESVDEVWVINEEQREYYTNQFQTMQPDLKGVISGATAKEFFEKSKLPVQELSQIWQLSDVDRDGSLSLEEFCIAMHLVVLRRNDIELPPHLPPALQPYVAFVNPDEPFAADLPQGSTLKRLTPSSPPPNQWAPTFPPESPTSSAVSSPGNKPAPVNFEFKPVSVETDSRIIHPVALRMSPDGHAVPVTDPDREVKSCDDQRDQGPNELSYTPIRRGRAYTDSAVDIESVQPIHQLSTPLQSRPRPTPKKSHSLSGQAPDPMLLPPPASQQQDIGAAQSQPVPPPAVPPRPKEPSSGPKKLVNQVGEPVAFSAIDSAQSNFADFSRFQPIPSQEVLNATSDGQPVTTATIEKHRRSVSLDYNHYSSNSRTNFQSISGAGDATDAGATISRIATDFKKSDTPPGGGGGVPRQRHLSRDEVSKKEKSTDWALRLFAGRQGSMDRKDLQAAIRKQRERNTMLSRLNNELNQELQEVMEQRIALEIQLEHLRPFSN